MIKMENKVTLKINNNQVPLNTYVKNVFINVILGIIKTLKLLPENINKIEITIEDQK